MALSRIIIILHQVGIDTRSYKNYVFDLQDDINTNWLYRMMREPDFNRYLYKCRSRYYDFSGEYKMAIREYHLTPKEAYEWTLEEFINK